jgi:hypothetical protein
MMLHWLRKHQPDPSNTGGEFARHEAERELERVRSETPYYEGLGRDLRNLRERNHIAEHLRATIRGA